MNRTIGAALSGRLDHDRERGSMPFLFLVMILSVALGAVMLSTVVSQARTSGFDESRVRSLDAAQSGLDYALAQIRGSVDTADTSVGDAGQLPCLSRTPVTDNALAFEVSVTYYRINPATLSDAARASGASAMKCVNGIGTYDSQGRTPRYALITSTGRDRSRSADGATRSRTLESTYVFQTNDANLVGGQIKLYPSGTYCMDAGDSPAAGTAVRLQSCSTANPTPDAQVWAYRSDLSIELVSSARNGAVGLCIDTANSPAAHAANQAVVLKQCGVADASTTNPETTSVCPAGTTPDQYKAANTGRSCAISPWHQRWSVIDNGSFSGSKADMSDVDTFCLDAANQTAGRALLLQTCDNNGTSSRQKWVPSPTTGAGAAGAGNAQIVNYAQFATCMDVTYYDVKYPYMVLYTCKQNPNPSKVGWNQKFAATPALSKGPVTSVISVTDLDGKRYCLMSPLKDGGYPTLTSACPSTPTGAYAWRISGRYASSATNSGDLAYAERYTIKDSQGRCLDVSSPTDLFISAYRKLVVDPCDGSTAQKWNADPSQLKATVTNTRETSGS